jgi:hypothetical protein
VGKAALSFHTPISELECRKAKKKAFLCSFADVMALGMDAMESWAWWQGTG